MVRHNSATLCSLVVTLVYAAPGLNAQSVVASGIQPQDSRCEHLVNPQGIDNTQPRLSWTLRAIPAKQRGQEQTAYQILVASNEQHLAKNQGDLWDSGKVQSRDCAEVNYAGLSLGSFQWCYWKVRVWDKDGVVSHWSEPASWSMGVLDPKLWQGKWLGYTKVSSPSSPAVAPGGKPWAQKAPSPVFRKGFDVEKPISRATAVICGVGYYELHLNGSKVGDRVLDPKFTGYDRRVLYATYDVTRQLTQGKNVVGVMLGNGFYNPHSKDVWNFEQSPWRGEPAVLFQLRIDFADGTSKTIASDATWRASTGPVRHDGVRNGEDYDARLELPGWDTTAFDDSRWATPQVVAGPKGALSSGALRRSA